MLHVRTLGELRQKGDGNARPLRRKPLALLTYLARRSPQSISRTELATLFWGERGEERARQSLRQALLELKQALGDQIDIDAESVRLAPSAVELDIVSFERDLADGRVQEAAQRWTGDFLEGADDIGGDGFLRWIENERVALRQQLRAALTRLIGDAELRGDWNSAAAWAQRWAAALPFEEEPHRRLIETLRMGGRSAEALKAHGAYLTRVRASRDIEPSEEFLQLAGDLADAARDEVARKGRGSAAVHAPAFVGRAAVMGELADAWKRASHGDPVVVLLEGAAGSGLTRVCDELVGRLGSEAVVLKGCAENATSDYACASALFDGIRNAEGSAGAAPEALAEVARLVPSLKMEFRHLPPATGDATALRDGLAQTLAAIGEEQPVLVVLDDLYDADEASRTLIASLASRLTGRVMLLLTADESKRDTGPALAARIDTRRLRLLPLSELLPADVETMIGSMVAVEARDRRSLALRLHEDSGGLPFEVRELVTSLVDSHLLQFDTGGTWHLSPAFEGRPLPVPPSVRERVRARLDRLSPSARALACAVAVLDGPVTTAAAGAVAELTRDEAESAANELIERRILRETSHPGQLQLSYPLLARAVAALVPPTRRESLQARAIQEAIQREAKKVPTPARPPSRPAPRVGGLALSALAVGVLALLALRSDLRFGSARPDAPPMPVIALGHIADYRDNATTDLTKPLTDMLATNLGRVGRLRVVSTARIYELVSQGDRKGDTSAASLVSAARRAGATELVDGALYAQAGGGFRLDLRRVELASGSIQKTHSVTGRTLFELADSGTARLAADFGETTPAGSIADVTTRSIVAYRLYEQGLRAYFANDLTGAQPLFEAALKEDSTFAMAAYYSAMSLVARPYDALQRYYLAARLATRTSDRERLTILARVAFLSADPALRALADTLVIRYPDEVDGYYYRGLQLLQDGEFLQALEPLNRVVAMDSLALEGGRARCSACDALHQLISAYQLADSLPAAERESRRWIRLQPRSSVPWHHLTDVLSQSGRYAEALAAFDRESELDAGRREDLRLLTLAVHRIYAGDFEQADRLLAAEIESGSRMRSFEALWYRPLSYRYQGRLEEALVDARRQRQLALAALPRGFAVRRRAAPPEALSEAQILFEMGRYRASAALFDSISRWAVGTELPSQIAHARVWSMTHAAGALAAAGDTAALAARIDSIQVLGALSGLGRDRALHHYVRGLLLAARGDDEAAVAELKRAVVSWSFGYTRVNMALATILLRQGKARQAVAALQPVLRGSTESSNFYVSRTDVHEMLGRAWLAVGDAASRDSAAAHFAVVHQAWRRADATFAMRRARATVN